MNPNQNQLIRGLTSDFAARFLLADVTEVAETARTLHKLQPAAATLAAKCIAASALFSIHIKGEERLTVQLVSESPRFSFLADVNSEGSIRARLRPKTLQRSSLATIDGALMVIKHNASKELYRGITSIENEPIDTAMENHLKRSTQVDIVLRIIVQSNEDNTIQRALGFLVERLPEATDIPFLDTNEVTKRYDSLRTREASDLIEELNNDHANGSKLHEMDRRPTFWFCKCSKHRIESMLFSLGPDELRSMLMEQGEAEVVCDFCSKKFLVDAHGLQRLVDGHASSE